METIISSIGICKFDSFDDAFAKQLKEMKEKIPGLKGTCGICGKPNSEGGRVVFWIEISDEHVGPSGGMSYSMAFEGGHEDCARDSDVEWYQTWGSLPIRGCGKQRTGATVEPVVDNARDGD